jgi:ribonuclease P protein subunit RPR2
VAKPERRSADPETELQALRAELDRYRAAAASSTDGGELEVQSLRVELEQQRADNAVKEDQLDRYAAELRASARRERQRTRELAQSYMATVRALAGAVEARDAYTAHHADRVTAYGLELAAASGIDLVEEFELECAFLLHDIGKVAIPDAILWKPESLTDKERAVVADHPAIGSEIISGIGFLGEAAHVVRSHHERWDGNGYPDGLAGEEIPLVARVFAVADVLDALTTDRPYRPASPLKVAREMINAESGTHFDPSVIEAFNTIPDETFDLIRSEVR